METARMHIMRLCHLDPRPTKESIEIAYKQYYTHQPATKHDFCQLGRRGKIRYALGNGYKNWRCGTTYQPASKFGIPLTFFLPRLRKKIDRYFRNLDRPQPGASLLDVGFGNGAFLDLAQNAGWKVAGADPDPATVSAALKRGDLCTIQMDIAREIAKM